MFELEIKVDSRTSVKNENIGMKSFNRIICIEVQTIYKSQIMLFPNKHHFR